MRHCSCQRAIARASNRPNPLARAAVAPAGLVGKTLMRVRSLSTAWSSEAGALRGLASPQLPALGSNRA